MIPLGILAPSRWFSMFLQLYVFKFKMLPWFHRKMVGRCSYDGCVLGFCMYHTKSYNKPTKNDRNVTIFLITSKACNSHRLLVHRISSSIKSVGASYRGPSGHWTLVFQPFDGISIKHELPGKNRQIWCLLFQPTAWLNLHATQCRESYQ